MNWPSCQAEVFIRPPRPPGNAVLAGNAGPKRLSALDAAAKVLTETSGAMTSQEMIEAMASKGYWTSSVGKTPHATLYAAILREIVAKRSEARFKKTERGKFATSGVE